MTIWSNTHVLDKCRVLNQNNERKNWSIFAVIDPKHRHNKQWRTKKRDNTCLIKVFVIFEKISFERNHFFCRCYLMVFNLFRWNLVTNGALEWKGNGESLNKPCFQYFYFFFVVMSILVDGDDVDNDNKRKWFKHKSTDTNW